MLKSPKALAAALLLASTAVALAVTGQAPTNGPGLQDGTWLNGLAGGQNETYQYGIAAAGSGQSTATVLPAGIALIEVDSGTGGVALPFCYQGEEFSIYNNTASTVTVYPNAVNNPMTAAQDTINNTTSLSMTARTPYYFACAKNGVWSGK